MIIRDIVQGAGYNADCTCRRDIEIHPYQCNALAVPSLNKTKSSQIISIHYFVPHLHCFAGQNHFDLINLH